MSAHLSKERSSLCSFSFADGRRCRMARCSAHPHLCAFHARKEAQALAAQQVGRDISSVLSNSYVSACDLSSALASNDPIPSGHGFSLPRGTMGLPSLPRSSRGGTKGRAANAAPHPL
jgi:hypothetical protein